ncbi:MAG TPA: DUF433 domain-containing protein [Aldersonia sp.]
MPGVSEEEQRLMLTRQSVARIADVSLARLDYWARTELIWPRVDRTLSPRNRVRLYDFTDALAVTVAAELNRRGVSLQHVRRIVSRLRERGYDRPLTQITYATVGKQLYFQHEDGTGEGGLHPDQIVIHEVLNLMPLRERIADSAARDSQNAGRFERRRGALGSKPVFAGTRIPVATIRRYLAAGRSVEDVTSAYPDLTEADVEAVQREMVG